MRVFVSTVSEIKVYIKLYIFFVFGIIAISTARVNYVCHKKITVENATVNW